MALMKFTGSDSRQESGVREILQFSCQSMVSTFLYQRKGRTSG